MKKRAAGISYLEAGSGQPVMVWVHGGAFIEGWAGTYRPPNIVANLVKRV